MNKYILYDFDGFILHTFEGNYMCYDPESNFFVISTMDSQGGHKNINWINKENVERIKIEEVE
ncbi:hypothetical protein ST39-O_gp12 [Clostridium phage phiCP39-O]|uniref:hypothetical protein n=1 Tax=Clostridium phage phiCP39-O TaxID=541865 RepID=UPI000181BE73|nr:hypothetical protein ST39-O_gp12 [Clostridium phage phiCP39-O]ACE81994.1 hypothetical protein [Clostridium phage phiCP39-O]